jgi:hypothetical protein
MKDRKSIFCVLVLLGLDSFGIKNHQNIFNRSAARLNENWAIFTKCFLADLVDYLNKGYKKGPCKKMINTCIDLKTVAVAAQLHC